MSKARTWFTVSGILITAVLFFFALRFCTQLPEETVHKIALISPVHARELGEAMRLGADAAAKEFGVELVYIGLKQQDGAAQQRKAVEQALKNDVAAVLIDPADNEILEVIGELSAAKQAPVILLNDERTAKGVMAAISVDNLQAGRKAGEAMAGLLGGSGGVAVIGSELDDPDLAAREAGLREAIAGYPGIRVADRAVCGSSHDACWQAVMQMLGRSAVEGIIALEEAASLGAVKEAQRRGIAGTLKIVTFGNEFEQLELLQDNLIQKTVVQSGFSVGYLGVKQAVALLNGERVNKLTRLDTRVIDSDNMFWMDNQKLLFPFVE